MMLRETSAYVYTISWTQKVTHYDELSEVVGQSERPVIETILVVAVNADIAEAYIKSVLFKDCKNLKLELQHSFNKPYIIVPTQW